MKTKKVSCPQCNETYKLTDPPSLLIDVFAKIDELIQAAVPYFFLTGLAGSVLVTSTTYGAYAVLTVCGLEEGEHILGSPNPWTWRVWVGLPMIPWVLIMSRGTLLDTVMPLLPVLILGNDPIRLEMPPSPRLIVSTLPWIRLFYNTAWYGIFGRLERSWREHNDGALQTPTPAINDNRADQDWEDDPLNDQQADALDPAAYIFMERKDLARTVVGALLLPAISSVAGNLISHIPFIRNRLPDTFIRSIIGGCLFVFLKDITNLLYKYHLVRRLRNRHVKSVKPRKK
ncbi:hypothetical protein DSO57_1037520 [Entomophthora muscae]|uniref:Uncharacterized protein n=1 Tax=Entomophthora muscae TaxID=34485 RepID=A0ACC2SZ70_9FUNG|nr:hypothetical protein DSO57_1037520 [Entomophthora muscae]